MEIIIAAFLVIVFTLANSLTFIAGSLMAQKGEFFWGTVHWPADYFYYLSQFAQGRYSWAAGYDLYTSDFVQKTYVGWVNVFLGHVFHLVGANPIWAYQISVAVFTALFLALSYLLIKEIFAGEKSAVWKSLAAFFLFNIANAFPKWGYEGKRLVFYYYDYWFNNGLPFTRLVGVPHQMMGKAMLILILLLSLWWSKGRRNLWILLGFVLVSFTLVSVEPVHWGLVILVFLTTSLLRSVCFFPHLPTSVPKKHILPVDSSWWIIILVFSLTGLPMFLYLKKLFIALPYSQLAAWEAAQQTYIPIQTFIPATGPVIVGAAVGMRSFIRKMTYPKLLLGIFTAVSLLLFFSPVPPMLKIVNVRFLPVIFILFLAILSSEAIFWLAKKAGKYGKTVVFSLLFLTFLIVLPGWIVQMQTRLAFDKTNAYYFVPTAVTDAFGKAREVGTQADTFLVAWPFNVSFPGVTGLRTYEGHHLLTIDPATKDRLLFNFIEGKMAEDEMRGFLRSNRITYVLTYVWTPILKSSLFTKVYANDYLGVWRVNSY